MTGKAREPPRLPENAGVKEAAKWVDSIVRFIGPGFHPDERFDSYINLYSGERSFAPELCNQLQRDLDRARSILDAAGIDICDVALPVQRRLLR